ncbi:MAG TPA: mannose-1-phosphate guanylyltransferase/mannose-6-phosphate isomerase [Acidimicrobiia bacterium]|jgi:mannose-1-phosphate guanylyltransferase/mannose-6-phosphate isomerase
MIVPVILSGGSGTRLWPLSRPAHPKQLLAMVDDRTMLRATIDRLVGVAEAAPPIVVCNADHHHLVATELAAAGHDPDRVVLEPIGRNTAPALAAAALLVDDQASLLLVLPADHVVENEPAFREAVAAGVPFAEEGRLVTFGIVPRSAETGYGYIEMGEPLSGSIREVAAFVEKPDLATAERYVAGGDHLWNSGMFLFRADRFLEELERRRPDIVAAVRHAVAGAVRDNGIHLDATAFGSSPSDSIDYAVMEHTDAAVVVPLDAGWSDVGSWLALWELSSPDSSGNVTIGDVIAIDMTGSYVRAGGRLVAAIGLDDVVVVDTPDALLVAAKERSQDVKGVVDRLRAGDRPEAERNRRERRPWGSFEVLETGSGYQVKRLTVSAGRRLSLQRHRNRAEKWTVVAGTGVVTVDEERTAVSRGDTVSIDVGSVHRVMNDGETDLEIIEVQVGSYLGEDDIERLEDDYGRS